MGKLPIITDTHIFESKVTKIRRLVNNIWNDLMYCRDIENCDNCGIQDICKSRHELDRQLAVLLEDQGGDGVKLPTLFDGQE